MYISWHDTLCPNIGIISVTVPILLLSTVFVCDNTDNLLPGDIGILCDIGEPSGILLLLL